MACLSHRPALIATPFRPPFGPSPVLQEPPHEGIVRHPRCSRTPSARPCGRAGQAAVDSRRRHCRCRACLAFRGQAGAGVRKLFGRWRRFATQCSGRRRRSIRRGSAGGVRACGRSGDRALSDLGRDRAGIRPGRFRRECRGRCRIDPGHRAARLAPRCLPHPPARRSQADAGRSHCDRRARRDRSCVDDRIRGRRGGRFYPRTCYRTGQHHLP